MIVHALLSWKARIGRLLRRRRARLPARYAGGARPASGAALRRHSRAADAEPNEDARRRGRRRQSAGRAAPPRRAARAARRSGNGYVLPSLNLLTAQRVSERTTLSKDIIDANAAALESVLRRFRRARRNHQCASRPGGDAVRTRARARHQVVARHRARRRHRPLDERGVGARRRRFRPQRHRHRTAQSDARESLFARTARRPRTTTKTPPSCRSASARPSAASR